MLFNNKITTDKNQEKLYKKGRNIIEEKSSGIEHVSLFEEGLSNTREHLTNRPVSSSNIRREVFRRRGNSIKKVSEKLFKESLFDIFYESLLIDEYFKSMNKNNLHNLFNDTFNNLMENGSISWDEIKNDSSIFVENLFNICEEVAKDKAEKNITFDSVKNDKVDKDALLNEKDKKKEEETATKEDKDKVDEETKKDKKDVSEVVKDKVVKTIKDEKEKVENEKEDDDDIKEETKTDKEKEEEASTEADDASADNGGEDVETDSSEKTTDTEGETETKSDDEEESEDDSKDDSKEEDINSDEDKKDDSKEEDKKEKDSKDEDEESEEDEEETKSESFYLRTTLRKPNKMKNTSLFRSIEMNVSNKFLKEKKEGLISEDIEMNLDMIFAESLSYYTLLETFSTLNILKLKPSQLKSLCKELILK